MKPKRKGKEGPEKFLYAIKYKSTSNNGQDGAGHHPSVGEYYRKLMAPHFSEPGAKNEYNPEGITLAAVKAGLRPFFDDELDLLLVYEAMESLHDRPAHPSTSAWAGKKLRSALGSNTHLIQDKDKTLAALIHIAPVSMILRQDVAEAIARWCYAAWHSRSDRARQHGQNMLGMIRRTGKSPPKKSPYSDYSLAKAYADLTLYCAGLARCILDAGKRTKFVRKYYPEYKELKKLGIPIPSIIRNHLVIPKPPNIAKTILMSLTGLSRTALLDRIKNGRKMRGPLIRHITDT